MVVPLLAKLLVRDPAASSRWYQALGFRSVDTMSGPGGNLLMDHLRRGPGQDLMLIPDPPGYPLPGGRRGQGLMLTLTVDDDVDALAARARAAGAVVVEGPVDKPWRCREVTLEDPDGYRMTFSKMMGD